MNKILVVLPYSQSGSQGKELYLCLNLWRKFCKFPFHFVVIGEFDEKLRAKFDWVDWIYKPKKEKRLYQYNQHLDVQECEEIVYERFGSNYDGFIWMADDNYAIKPFDFEDISTIHYLDDDFKGQKDLPCSFWKHDKWKTKELLLSFDLPTKNYTTHYPCFLEFSKLKEIWNKFDMRNESYVLEDVYFNYFPHEKPIKADLIRLGIWKPTDFLKINEVKSNTNIKFIANSELGFTDLLEDELERILKNVL